MSADIAWQGTLIANPKRRPRVSTPLPSFVCTPTRSAPQLPTCAHKRRPLSQVPQVPVASLSSSLTRRQTVLTLSLISVYFLSSPCSGSPEEEIIFTKLAGDDNSSRPVEIHDYRVGTGRPAENGCLITVKWTGRLADRYGWPIQNEDADEVSFLLGSDKLIRGFEIAIQGMREGGKRRMIIPAELGYKDQQSGPLPASYGDRRRLLATVLNSRRFKRAGDVVIDVQLLKVRSHR